MDTLSTIESSEYKPKEVTWVVSSSIKFVDSTTKDFEKWLKYNLPGQFDDDTITDMSVGFKEIFTNAISYGNLQWKPEAGQENITQEERLVSIAEKAKKNPDLANKQVKVTLKFQNRELVVTVLDSGHGFDVNSLPDPTKPENLTKNTGRGILMTRAYFDEVLYEQTPVGLQVTLKKQF